MATTVHEPPQIERRSAGPSLQQRMAKPGSVRRRSAPGYALLSPSCEYRHLGNPGVHHDDVCRFYQRLIVRQGGATDWRHFTLPSVLYVNTLVIIASSITLEISRRQIASFMGGVQDQDKDIVASPAGWLYVTLFLGFLFIAGQTLAWLQLRSRGFGLASNISYSFFYVLTIAHALHVLGGLGGLVRVIGKLHNSVLRRSTLDATSHYWHFIGVLWLYLLLLIWMKL